MLNESTSTCNQLLDNTNMERDMDKDMERDMEKDMEKDVELEKSSQDPFAGEEVGGVRYRTMKWW